MRRVHDALRGRRRAVCCRRRAADLTGGDSGGGAPSDEAPDLHTSTEVAIAQRINGRTHGCAEAPLRLEYPSSMLSEVGWFPSRPLRNRPARPKHSHETPAEEFRHTAHALNHPANIAAAAHNRGDQSLARRGQDVYGGDLALAQSHLAENSVLFGRFRSARPIVHNLFQIDRRRGLSDFLTGQCTFAQRCAGWRR